MLIITGCRPCRPSEPVRVGPVARAAGQRKHDPGQDALSASETGTTRPATERRHPRPTGRTRQTGRRPMVCGDSRPLPSASDHPITARQALSLDLRHGVDRRALGPGPRSHRGPTRQVPCVQGRPADVRSGMHLQRDRAHVRTHPLRRARRYGTGPAVVPLAMPLATETSVNCGRGRPNRHVRHQNRYASSSLQARDHRSREK